ncbi:M16 family metallopeptidase [Propioniciclava flava]|uniref:M16 family metallopeptidase n=1 Tax=Propioniciclava flava TaxID=2072026 RepID=UPI0013E99920|nr:pitrilysin family protein [Propioniciclava flava]
MNTVPQPDLAPSPRWEFPPSDSFTLSNGLDVTLFHLPGQYVASVGLLIDAPLSGEPREIEGVATVVASALIEGTRSHPGPSFAEAIEDQGAVLGGAVDFSATQVLLDVPTRHLDAALPLLAQAVAEPTLTDDAIARHAAQLTAGLEQQLATGPGRAAHALRAALIDPTARESRSRTGSPTSIAGLQGHDARAYHTATYGPRGARLIVSGDLADGIAARIQNAFEGWTNPAQTLIAPQTPRPATPRAIIIDRPEAVQADIRMGWFTLDRADPRWAALQLATHALGGAYLSRLNRVLREEKGFTYGIHLVNAPMRRGGLSYTQAAFRTEVVGEALALTRSILQGGEFSTHEIDRARDYLTGTTPLRYATAAGVTSGVLSQAAAGLPADFVPRQLDDYTRVTPEAASKVAEELLLPQAATLVVVGDAQALLTPLHEAGFDAEVRASDAN